MSNSDEQATKHTQEADPSQKVRAQLVLLAGSCAEWSVPQEMKGLSLARNTTPKVVKRASLLHFPTRVV